MTDDIEPLFEEDVGRTVEEAFDQLVEAWEDLVEAEQALRSYKSATAEPQAPSFFESRDQLTEFVLLKGEYDRGLSQVTVDQEFAQKRYDEAVGRANALLPEGSALIYDYRGAHGYLQGTRYIVRSQPNIPRYARTGRPAKITVEVQTRPKPQTST